MSTDREIPAALRKQNRLKKISKKRVVARSSGTLSAQVKRKNSCLSGKAQVKIKFI